MKPIIPPIDRDILLQELNDEKFLRKTNNGNNMLYVITHHDSPGVMQEIGRLRELTFRAAGGGTGKEGGGKSPTARSGPSGFRQKGSE